MQASQEFQILSFVTSSEPHQKFKFRVAQRIGKTQAAAADDLPCHPSLNVHFDFATPSFIEIVENLSHMAKLLRGLCDPFTRRQLLSPNANESASRSLPKRVKSSLLCPRSTVRFPCDRRSHTLLARQNRRVVRQSHISCRFLHHTSL